MGLALVLVMLAAYVGLGLYVREYTARVRIGLLIISVALPLWLYGLA